MTAAALPASPEQLHAVEMFAELTAEAVARRLAKAPPTAAEVEALLRTWLATRRAENTRRMYDQALGDLARHLGAAPVEAAARLLGSTRGAARLLVVGWQADMRVRDLSPSTINGRVAAIRSLILFACEAEVIGWTLKVPNEPAELRRDTRGPGREGFESMLRVLDAGGGNASHRLRALLRLLHDLALRVNEALSLDLAHVDLAAPSVSVRRKGRRERLSFTLPEPTRAALADWLLVRGGAPGPVFVTIAGRGGVLRWPLRRWARESAAQSLRALGEAAGLKRRVRPHGLRHEGITRALDATGGDVRTVMRFSGHAKPETLLIYDDRYGESAVDVARLVAGG